MESKKDSKGKNKMIVDDFQGETSENKSLVEIITNPKSEPNSPEPMETDSPKALIPLEEDLPNEQQVENQEFVCKYCDKKFYNKQALGGHQNAHKVERALEKSEKERAKGGSGYGATGGTDFYTFSNMNSHYFPNSFARYPDHLVNQPIPPNRFFPYALPGSPYPSTLVPVTHQDPYASRLVPSPTNTYHAGWPRPMMTTNTTPLPMHNPFGNAYFTPPPLPPPVSRGVPRGFSEGVVVGNSDGASTSGVKDNEEPELDLTLKL